MTARSWGLSENARIVREDVHIHSYVDITATTFPCVLHMCIVKLNCPFPFRWRWNDFFDWTYCKEDPRLYEVMPEALNVCRAVSDERTCETCAFFDRTDAVPPHDSCTSENGCRCYLVAEER